MDNVIRYLERRVQHAEKRASDIRLDHGDKPLETHNYIGGHSLGYWDEMATAYENVLWQIKEEVRNESSRDKSKCYQST